MELIKRCPACGEENPVSEIICRTCMTNLSAVSPIPKGLVEGPKEEKEQPTLSSPCPVLTLICQDGRPLAVGNGSELGREGDYQALLNDIKTVSRRHARIIHDSQNWQVEDLNSTNGTWVNGKRLTPGVPCPLKIGDLLSLSLTCELKVIA